MSQVKKSGALGLGLAVFIVLISASPVKAASTQAKVKLRQGGQGAGPSAGPTGPKIKENAQYRVESLGKGSFRVTNKSTKEVLIYQRGPGTGLCTPPHRAPWCDMADSIWNLL